MKKYLISMAGGVLVGFVSLTPILSSLFAQETEETADLYRQLDLLGIIFERVEKNYVETTDPESLVEAAIDGMLRSLDPHSSYLSPRAFKEMQVDTRGEFGGLGIEVTQEEGYVKIISPMDGTPAMEAGVQAGDFIIAVDGESLLGLNLAEAVEMMRGPVGSETSLTIRREGVEDPFVVNLVRAVIKLTAARVRVVGDAVVVRVSTFNNQTYPNVRDGLEKAFGESGGPDAISGVVLDLRNNPGGLLSAAVDLSDAFLEGGAIVSTLGRDTRDSEHYIARKGDLIDGKPMVVLINGGSASASEIVAGALQDHRRAVVIGQRSFGKGSVQTLIPIQNNGAIRLTTARYYTPSGRSIQALGVAPDIVVRQRTAPERDQQTEQGRSEASLRGALSNDLTDDERRQAEEEHRRAEQTARLRREDYQLAYALDILHGLGVVGAQD